jgi:hypothetical protein
MLPNQTFKMLGVDVPRQKGPNPQSLLLSHQHLGELYRVFCMLGG